MARGKITQTRFPELVGSWPVVRAPIFGSFWITLADFRTCKSPASGSLCAIIYEKDTPTRIPEAPPYGEIVTRGESVRIATYKNAAELHELGRLTKRIEDGKA